MNKIQELYQSLKPYIAKDFNSGVTPSSSGSSSGSGSLTAHGLSSAYHTGTLATSQAPWALNRDGSRSLTGNMLVDAGVTIDGVDVGSPGGGLTLSGSQLMVDQNYGFAWSAQHSFGAGLLATHVGATGALTLEPGGDLTLTPGGEMTLPVTKTFRTPGTSFSSTFPIGGFRIAPTSITGQSSLIIGVIEADELRVKVFVADETRVDRGELWISKSYGVVYLDFTTPASVGSTVKVYFENSPAIAGAIFSTNDWLLFRSIDRSGGGLQVSSVWGQVTSYADESATYANVQSWIFTLRSGAISQTMKKGVPAIDFGASGQSFIQQTVIDPAGAPYIKMARWTTNPYSPANYTTDVKIGKLISSDDADLAPTGNGILATNAYLKGKLLVGNGNVMLDSNGMSIVTYNSFAAYNRVSFHWASLAGAEQALVGARSWNGSDYQLLLGAKGVSSGSWGSIALRARTSTQAGIDGTLDSVGGNMFVQPANIYVGPTAGMAITADTSIIGSTVPAGQLWVENIKRPNATGTADIGTVGNPFSTLYVDTIVATTLGGSTSLSGNTWQEDSGNMFIKSASSSPRTLYIANPGTGAMHLDVEGDITLGGTVDGVDVAALGTAYSSHIADHNAHHNQSHVLATAGALGSDHTVSGLTAGMVLKATGATTAQFAQLQFSELGGTTTDILSQYVHISVARTITAIHTFSPGSATAPFFLSSNAQGQTVTGLKADQLNRSVIAGNGLTGGGALTASITISVNFGTPTIGTITPNATASAGSAATVAHSDHVHAIATAAPTTALSVSTTNAEGSASSFARSDHVHAVTSSSNPGAAAALLASTGSGGLTLQTLTLAGTGDVVVSAAGSISMADNTDITAKFGMAWMGNVGYSGYAGFAHRSRASAGNYAVLQDSLGNTFLNASSTKIIYHRINNDDVLQMNAQRLNPAGSGLIALGDENRKYSELHAVQLIVDNLVASNVMATIGGHILVAPTAKLTRDITASATTIYLDSSLAGAPQELYMAGLKSGTPQNEHMRIISGPVNTGTDFSYVVTRNIKALGNLLGTNNGFELGDTSNWAAFYSSVAAYSSFAVSSNSAQGAYSGLISLNTLPGGYAGMYCNVTCVAGTVYSVSYWLSTLSVNGVHADTQGPGGLSTTYTTITGTTTWTRYAYEFTALGTGTHQVRFWESSPTGGAFWVDEVIVEPKFATNGYAWYIGDANVDIGYDKGSGYIDLTSLTTLQGHYGPTVAVYSHNINGGQPKPTAVLGNLRSFVDYAADTMGWAVGNDLTLSSTGGFSGMTGDAKNGLRLFNVEQGFYSGTSEKLHISINNGISFANVSTAPAMATSLNWYKNGVGASLTSTDLLAYIAGYNNSLGGSNLTLFVNYAPAGSSELVAYARSEGTVASSALQMRGDQASTSPPAIGQATISAQYVGIRATSGTIGALFHAYGVAIGSVPISGGWLNNTTGFTPPADSLNLTKNWQSLAGASSSEISNDTGTYKALMLVGNTSAGGNRRVNLYDQLAIGFIDYTATLNINGGIYLRNTSTPSTPSTGAILYAIAGKLWVIESTGATHQL